MGCGAACQGSGMRRRPAFTSRGPGRRPVGSTPGESLPSRLSGSHPRGAAGRHLPGALRPCLSRRPVGRTATGTSPGRLSGAHQRGARSWRSPSGAPARSVRRVYTISGLRQVGATCTPAAAGGGGRPKQKNSHFPLRAIRGKCLTNPTTGPWPGPKPPDFGPKSSHWPLKWVRIPRWSLHNTS